jgi:hypothetical protein
MGRFSSQVKQCREATSPRNVSGIVHLSAKNTRGKKEHLGAQKNFMEALSIHYEPTFSV